MLDFFTKLFSTDFMPHGHCYLWSPEILWLHVISDLFITISYYSIPVALFLLVYRRKDISFNWIFVFFALFIFACGTTHLMEIWNVWHGTYRLTGVIKAITAITSMATAILLWRLIPTLLTLVSPEELEKINTVLSTEVAERKRAEEKMLMMNAELEKRVQASTTDLQLALAQKEEILLREREARLEIEKISKLKEEFLATLSHELRNPLNAVSTWIQLLARSTPGDKQNIEVIPILDRNVKHLSHIIEDLLDMSDILTGSVSLKITRYNLNSLVEDIIQNVRTAAEVKKISFITNFTPALPLLKGDVVRMRQVIWNLLSNAIKFNESGKPITVTTTIEGSTVLLTIVDYGNGITPQFLPFVFDRFRQEESSITREYAGLGLGLSIAKQLAELHGGTITAHSEGTHKGATFILYLPFTQEGDLQ